MTDLKLAKLPDRTPVKLNISVLPKLHRALEDYARVYQQVHGSAETVAGPIPLLIRSHGFSLILGVAVGVA